jgi:hypothetical protein
MKLIINMKLKIMIAISSGLPSFLLRNPAMNEAIKVSTGNYPPHEIYVKKIEE